MAYVCLKGADACVSKANAPWFARPRAAVLCTAALCILLFFLRLAGPPELMDNDQERPLAYLMDARVNGNWIVQTDQTGDVMSKPPLSTWLTALIAAPWPHVTPTLAYLPCLLATIALAWMVLAAGSLYFGRAAGGLAALFLILSNTTYKQIALVRTDSLFAVLTFAAALAAFHAWRRGRGWTLFWLLAAAVTLTKGPLGVLLAALGLPAVLWERRSGQPRRLSGSHVQGLVIFTILVGGWFLLAYLELGPALVRKMLLDELLGHAVERNAEEGWSFTAYKPTLYFLGRFFPWSLLALWGIAVAWRRPANNPEERAFERFLFCYLLAGLAVFSIASHHRADHLWPLLPAAALLAGRQAARWMGPARLQRSGRWAMGAVALFLLVATLYTQFIRPRHEKIHRAKQVEHFARQIRSKVGNAFPLIHYRSPYYLQFCLASVRPRPSRSQVVEALGSGRACFVVCRHPERLRPLLAPGVKLHTLAECPIAGDTSLKLVSNHHALEYTPRMCTVVGPWLVEMDGTHLQRGAAQKMEFWAREPASTVRLTNTSEADATTEVGLRNSFPRVCEVFSAAPGETGVFASGAKIPAHATIHIAQLADCRSSYAILAQLGSENAFRGMRCVFINGDFVFENEWQYDLFLEQAEEFGVPIVPVRGNHEVVHDAPFPDEAFLNRFGYLHYAFADGPAHYVLLDTGEERLGEAQLEYLETALESAADKAPPQSVIFMHVPPRGLQEDLREDLEESMSEEDANRLATEDSRLLDLAAQNSVCRVYAGHCNGLVTEDYETSHGAVRVITSSGGGEKSWERNHDYYLHWLEAQIGPNSAQEIAIEIAEPGLPARLLGHILHRDIFFLRRFGPSVILPLLLLFVFGCAGRALSGKLDGAALSPGENAAPSNWASTALGAFSSRGASAIPRSAARQ